jgi:hypothetical protein
MVDFLPKEGNGLVLVRWLLRRAIEIPGARLKPNELIYTDDTFDLRRRPMKRKCSICFYTEKERHRLHSASVKKERNCESILHH